MIAAMGLGAGVGLGLLLLLSGIAPARQPLALASARLHRPANLGGSPPVEVSTALNRVARWLATTLGLNRIVEGPVEADLRVVRQTLDDHVASRVTIAILAAVLPSATAGLMVAGGVPVPIAVPASATLLLALGGYFVPLLTLRSQAAELRHSFRHALSSFLDLVAVTLAGGAGIETALHRSAQTGQGWAFDELRQALVGRRGLIRR